MLKVSNVHNMCIRHSFSIFLFKKTQNIEAPAAQRLKVWKDFYIGGTAGHVAGVR